MNMHKTFSTRLGNRGHPMNASCHHHRHECHEAITRGLAMSGAPPSQRGKGHRRPPCRHRPLSRGLSQPLKSQRNMLQSPKCQRSEACEGPRLPLSPLPPRGGCHETVSCHHLGSDAIPGFCPMPPGARRVPQNCSVAV